MNKTQPRQADPPGVEFRPIEGFPGYRIGSDKSVWSKRACRDRRWKRLRVIARRASPCVVLYRVGGPLRPWVKRIETLYREAFLAPPPRPTGTRRGECHDDDQVRDEPPAPVAPAPPRTRPAAIRPAPTSPPRPMPPPSVRRPLPVQPAPEHPGGPTRRGSRSRGAEHPKAKLDESGVIEARRLRSEGWLLSALAAKFGVSEQAMSAAVNARTWRHVVP